MPSRPSEKVIRVPTAMFANNAENMARNTTAFNIATATAPTCTLKM